MQSAADAGALAGTRMVAKNNVDSVPTSVLSEVTDVIQKNKMSGGNISSIDCNYVTDNGSVITPCVSVIPPTASGVEVKVTESHPTYFIRVVPGAPNTVSTNALARANVKIAPVIPGDGPYLPCGIHTQLVSGGLHMRHDDQDGRFRHKCDVDRQSARRQSRHSSFTGRRSRNVKPRPRATRVWPTTRSISTWCRRRGSITRKATPPDSFNGCSGSGWLQGGPGSGQLRRLPADRGAGAVQGG